MPHYGGTLRVFALRREDILFVTGITCHRLIIHARNIRHPGLHFFFIILLPRILYG